MLKKILIALSVVIVIGGAIVIFELFKKDLPTSGSGLTERTTYDAIGTAVTSSTLTTAYTGNRKVLSVGNLENLHLDIDYMPGGPNQYAYVLIEGSNDNGTTYFPMATKVIGTTEIDVYVEDTDGNAGIPMIIPGDKTSASGTYYKSMSDFDLVADHVRISAKESTQTSAGKIYIRTTITSR